jgi:hypothetical protein
MAVLGVHCDIYKIPYNISWLNSLPLSFFFISPPPIPGVVSTGLIFPFTYMSTQYLQHIHPHTPFPYILSPPTGTKLQTGLVLPSVLNFCKKNDICVCLGCYTRCFTVTFHVYMYYNLNWFVPFFSSLL